MVDVGAKPIQRRQAVASGFIALAPSTLRLLKDRVLPKGDVLTVARVAGVRGAKQTASLIPLCHQLPLDKVDIDFVIEERGIAIRATSVTSAQTGVEMEALTAGFSRRAHNLRHV